MEDHHIITTERVVTFEVRGPNAMMDYGPVIERLLRDKLIASRKGFSGSRGRDGKGAFATITLSLAPEADPITSEREAKKIILAHLAN